MPPKVLADQLLAITLAAHDAAKRGEIEELNSLLPTRQSLIGQIILSSLTPQERDTVRRADFLGRELEAILAQQIKEGKQDQREKSKAHIVVKNYRRPSPSAGYDLTG